MSATGNSLSDNERQLLAREIAADKECSYRDNVYRGAFVSGWNAAMEYVKQQRVDECTASIEGEMS